MRTAWICRAVVGVVALVLATAVAGRAAEAKGEPIKIGALFAETGPASNLGAPEAKTAAMLADQVNAAGGIKGRPIVIVTKDTGASAEKCVSFAKQLIEEEKVVAIVGPSTSGESLAIKALCEEAKVPLVSCAAAEKIVIPLAQYVFKTPQKDSQAVTWIYRDMRVKKTTKIGLVTDNTGFGQAGKEQLEKAAAEPGSEIEILASEVYDKQATDLTDILAKLKAKNVQAVVNWSIVPAQSIVPKNMKQIGLNVQLYQSHGFGNIKYAQQAGEAGEGLLFPAGRLLIAEQLPDAHPQKAVLVAYKKAYEARFKEDVSTFGGHAYDAVMIVVRALEVAGPDRAKVRDAIENLKGFVGTAGVFNLSAEDHNGLGLDAFEMLTVKGGKFAPAPK